MNFAIVGIENQELVDCAMPLRCMVYDAGEYEKQVFDFIRCTGDKKELLELVRSDSSFQSMEGRTAAVRGIVVKMVKKGKSDEEILELTECSAELLWEVREKLQM